MPESSWDKSDPIGDIADMARSIYEQRGYRPQRIFVSSRQKEQVETFMVWFGETKRLIETLPRRRFIARMVFRRMLYGPWYKRGRANQIRMWWRMRSYEDA